VNDTITVPSFDGGASTWLVNWTYVTIGDEPNGPNERIYQCGLSGQTPINCNLHTQFRVVSQIDLPTTPSSTHYQFEYSDNYDTPSFGFGELHKMILPTDGYITYEYSQQGLVKPLDDLLDNRVVSKKVYHDGNVDWWQYSYDNWTGSEYYNQITSPDSGETKNYYYCPSCLSLWYRGLVYKTVLPNGTS